MPRAIAIAVGMAFLTAFAGATAPSTARAQDLSNNQTCFGCHGNPGFAAPRADGIPRDLYVDRAAFEKSVMGKILPCIACHTQITEIPHGHIAKTEGDLRQSVPALCGTCHAEELKQYMTSVHGKEVLQNKHPWAAVCSDCHSAHGVERPSEDSTRLAIIKNCGTCHQANLESYRQTYHGQVTTLGYAYTAKCFDCHGSHTIQRVSDPASTVYPANRLQTCRKCHANATAGFATFQPHATTDDFERYPQTWLASKMMLMLLGGTFAFFWTHSALWLFREYRDRQQHKMRPHVRTDELPGGETLYYQRWPAMWRLAHLVFALAIIVLILTGMTLFYADSAWAPLVQRALGGPRVTGVIHRICAVVFTGVFVGHLVYVAYRVVTNWKTFRWFGPHSLIPNWQDIKDIFSMFKWFLGLGPRPLFDRFTYWEKFDYWAPFWGVTIIGVSGFMLWFPNLTAAFLPGWAFNVATIFHGEEAFLAAGFLFTVHFFNNHWRPDNFPLDIVMFTGAMPLDKFKREHRVEYDRLAQSGELKRYLVDAPSRPMTIGSKILGFFLMAAGLILLVLIMTGFVHGLSG
jgi:cytochrome b subunit of formate dehydrogenase/nitrate/TMAO reductase-like tetraheme cytochrome c subunit